MAKNDRLKMITTIIGLLVLGAGLVANYALQGDAVADVITDVVALKQEGCVISTENEKVIIGMQRDIESTAKTVEEIRTEQRTISNNIIYIRGQVEK